MDPIEEMLKTLEQMRLINREAQQSLKRLETVTLEDSRRGQRMWQIATAATQMPTKAVQTPPAAPQDRQTPTTPPAAPKIGTAFTEPAKPLPDVPGIDRRPQPQQAPPASTGDLITQVGKPIADAVERTLKGVIAATPMPGRQTPPEAPEKPTPAPAPPTPQAPPKTFGVQPPTSEPAPVPLAPARPTLNPVPLAPTAPPTYNLAPTGPNAPVPLAPPTPPTPAPAPNPYALQQMPQKIADSCECFRDALAPLITVVEKILAGVAQLVARPATGGGGIGDGGLQRGRDYDMSVTGKDVVDTSAKGQLTAAVGQVTGSLGMLTPVVTGAMQAFTSLTGQIGKFVEAVNPALMTAFAAAMRDLNATIGVALEPLMTAALAVARQFGAVLLPVMEQFRPIMEQVASQLVKLVQPYMQFIQELIKTSMPLVQLIADLSRAFQPLVSMVYGTLVNVLKVFAAALTPIITIVNLVAAVLSPVLKVFEMIGKITGSLTTVLVKFTSQISNVLISLSPLGIILKGLAAAGEMLTPVFEAIGVVVEAFSGAVYAALEGIGTWLKGLMGGGDWMDGIKSAFQQLAIGIVVVTAHLAKMVGWMGYIDSLKKTLGGGVDRKDATGRAAATNQQIGGLDSLRQSIMKASLLAGPQGMKTEEQTWRDKTLAELEKMNTGEDLVSKFMRDLQTYLDKQVPIWIRGAATTAVDTTATIAKQEIKKGGMGAAKAGVFGVGGSLLAAAMGW